MRVAADDDPRRGTPVEPTELVAVGGTASNLLKVTAGGVADRGRRTKVAHALRPWPSGVRDRRQRLGAIRGQPEARAVADGRRRDRRRPDAPVRGRRGPGVRRRAARRRDPRRRRTPVARGAIGWPSSPTAGAADGGPGHAQSPATTRPRARRKRGSGHAPPRSRRSSAAVGRPRAPDRPGTARSRRSPAGCSSPACSTRKVRVIEAVTSASFMRPEVVLEGRDPRDQRVRRPGRAPRARTRASSAAISRRCAARGASRRRPSAGSARRLRTCS